MSVFELEAPGSKGPGVITRLAIRMPKSASLWKWLLLLLSIFCPLFVGIGEYSYFWAFGYMVQFWDGGSMGWFIVFPFGEWYYYGPYAFIMWALYIPVFLALRSLHGIVRKRKYSRIARFFHWYYFLVTAFMYIMYIPQMFYYDYGIGIPLGGATWFLMYLRYKQLNYYLEQHLESWKTDTVAPVVTAPTTAPATAVATEVSVKVGSGYDIAGENLKLAVKVNNEGSLAIMNVTVNLDVPDGFEFVSGTLPSQKIGNISASSFQSAIFWLKPQRCVDDEYGGSALCYRRDAGVRTGWSL